MKHRNFWNSCPRQLEYFPKTLCPLGKQGAEAKGDFTKKAGYCMWFVNSSQDHYCFWKWLRRVSNKNGHFEPLLQHVVASLLRCSPTKSHFLFKEAFAKLEELEEFQTLKELY